MMVGIQVLPETIKLLISQNTAFDSVVKIYLAKNIDGKVAIVTTL